MNLCDRKLKAIYPQARGLRLNELIDNATKTCRKSLKFKIKNLFYTYKEVAIYQIQSQS